MTDSTPPGGLDSPPSTGIPQTLPAAHASPAQQRTPSTQHASASTTPSTPKDKDRGKGRRRDARHRPPRLPTSTLPRRSPATSRQQPPACIPSRLESATASNPHDTTSTEEEEGRGRRRRAADEEPRPRVKNFFTRPYIGRTPPRYTPKDTPAACILHRFQRPFSARLASRADRLQFCFWRVCRTRHPERPTTDAPNARPPAPCPPADGGAFTFSARRHF